MARVGAAARVSAAPQFEVATLPALAPMSTGAAPAQATSTPPPTQAPLASDAPGAGFWVQLGAFSQPNSASGLREQTARGMPSLGPQLKVFNERGLYRVQAGPFASREAAQSTAEQLRASLQLSPMVLERR